MGTSFDMAGVQEVLPRFKAIVEAAMRDQTPDNPIYRVRQMGVMRDVVTSAPERYILDQLEAIRQQLTNLTVLRSPVGPRLRPFALRPAQCRVDVQGTQEQINQFLKSLTEKGYRVSAQSHLLNPSQWTIGFPAESPDFTIEQISQLAVEFGVTVLDAKWA